MAIAIQTSLTNLQKSIQTALTTFSKEQPITTKRIKYATIVLAVTAVFAGIALAYSDLADLTYPRSNHLATFLDLSNQDKAISIVITAGILGMLAGMFAGIHAAAEIFSFNAPKPDVPETNNQ